MSPCAFLLLLALLPAALASGKGQSQNPLLDDSVRPFKSNGRAAECTFGKQMRELGSTWFADLGPPIGVMYCIRCECIPIQKKRRIVARVQCRNIKHECPEPTCAEPVLLPNRCCKTCPGDDAHSPDVVQDVAPAVSAEEEDKNWKHFAALLTGRTGAAAAASGPLGKATQHVATARFTFQRRSLYYSVLTAQAQRPRTIQFGDRDGNILEEQTVPAGGSLYQNATGKVCGVWRRLSRDYRRLLREDRLLVTLLWDQDDRGLTGAIQRHRALGPGELLSALLVPATGSDATLLQGSGGTAIVSASSSAPVPTIQIALLFNGVFSPQDMVDVPVSVRLETADRSRKVLEEVIRIAKPSSEVNEGSVAMPVSAADLRLLTRGKLVLTVESARRPGELALAGPVQPRATCELFQAPLSPSEAEAVDQEDSAASASQGLSSARPTSAPGGQAWLYVDRSGALVYNVQLLKVPGEDTLLTLVSGRGRRFVELEDLTPSLRTERSGAGWANGTLKLSPRELAQLYAGELAVNVATGSAPSLVRGRLVAKLVADARDGNHPILLTSSHSNVTGMAWVALDQDCSLHYDISLSPASVPPGGPPAQLFLEQVPFVAPGAPVSRRILDEFSSPQHEGVSMGLTHAELSRIDAGVTYLDVRLPAGSDGSTGAGLRGEFLHVKVPTVCLPHYSDNDVPFLSMSAGQSPAEPETLHCFHETRFYEDGAQWVSAQDPCTMCSCHRAHVRCDPVVCPPPACPLAMLVEPSPGHCCYSCRAPTSPAPPPPAPTTTTTMAVTSEAPPAPGVAVVLGAGGHGCRLGGQFHEAGSSWHPYVPPNGFDTCAVCTCNASTLETRCVRQQCPPLSCKEHEAVRPDPRACCRECPVFAAPSTVTPQHQAEQAAPKTVDEILAEGGCRNPLGKPHLNGDEWHPKISSHGEYKCVKCRCKDGKVKCDRKRCTRSACEAAALMTPPHSHAHSHAHAHQLALRREDACCSAQCRRFRRHHKPRR